MPVSGSLREGSGWRGSSFTGCPMPPRSASGSVASAGKARCRGLSWFARLGVVHLPMPHTAARLWSVWPNHSLSGRPSPPNNAAPPGAASATDTPVHARRKADSATKGCAALRPLGERFQTPFSRHLSPPGSDGTSRAPAPPVPAMQVTVLAPICIGDPGGTDPKHCLKAKPAQNSAYESHATK
jgi:hypothetical protein